MARMRGLIILCTVLLPVGSVEPGWTSSLGLGDAVTLRTSQHVPVVASGCQRVVDLDVLVHIVLQAQLTPKKDRGSAMCD